MGEIISGFPDALHDTIYGFYNDDDGKFYVESDFQTPISEYGDRVYIDMTNDYYSMYAWNGSQYIQMNRRGASNQDDNAGYVLEWDGDTTGRETFEYFDSTFAKISDDVFKNAEVFFGCYFQYYSERNGNIDVFIDSSVPYSNYFAFTGPLEEEYIIYVPADTTINGQAVTAGVYFGRDVSTRGDYVSWLKLDTVKVVDGFVIPKEYVTESELEKKGYAKQSDVKKASENMESHITNTAIHVTAEEKQAWNSKMSASEVIAKINEKISEQTHWRFEIVDSLPGVFEGEQNVIYLVPHGGNAENDFFDEYVFLDGLVEKIGDTRVNLSNYYDVSSVDSLLSALEASLVRQIPTETSQLTNNSGFITESTVVELIDNLKDYFFDVEEITIEWDGNTDGVYTVGSGTSILYKISDEPFRAVDFFKDGVTITYENGASSGVSPAIIPTETDGKWTAATMYGVAGVFNSDLAGVPEGIYVTAYNFSENGMPLSIGPFLRKKLKTECLPEHEHEEYAKRSEMPKSAADVGADPSGTAAGKVNEHNTSNSAHNDIRLQISDLTTRINGILDSDDVDLDQLSELVAHIKSNRTLIEGITTNKVSVTDIIDNLTTSVSNKPLSAKQGVALKALIDALQNTVDGIKVPTKVSDLENDAGYLKEHQNLSAYAKRTELPTKTSELTNDSKFVTETQMANQGFAKQTEVNQFREEIDDQQTQINNKQPLGNYLTRVPSEYVTETELGTKLVALKAEIAQQTPLSAKTIEDCIDSTKMYVIPDESDPEVGYVYGYGKTKEEITNTVVTPGEVTLIENTRYSGSSNEFKTADGYDLLIIPVVSEGMSDVITVSLTNMTFSDHWTSRFYGSVNNKFDAGQAENTASVVTGTSEVGYTKLPAGKWYFTACVIASNINNLGVTVDGEPIDVVVGTTSTIGARFPRTETTTEIVEKEGFYNTGIVYGASVVVDNELSGESKNPIQNKVVKVELDKIHTNIKELKEQSVDMASYIPTVCAPVPQLSADGSETADVDLTTCTSDDIHALLDGVVTRYPNYITRELMGKDASGLYDIYRYTMGKHIRSAWQKENYPKMYAWKNGSTIIYSISVSPRIGDTLYSTKYIGTAYGTVSAVSATNRSRTVSGVEFVRSENDDVSPTLMYTNGAVNGSTKVSNGATYYRYPFGDTDKDGKKRIPITIIANEHGGHEVRDCALIVTRMIKDLCECKYQDNPVLNYIRENVNLTVIPVVNPHGWNMYMNTNGYLNSNMVNINRNYDTVGWDYCYNNQDIDGNNKLGSYAGSENETQYVMNTMTESGAVIAMSVHGLSTIADNTNTYYQGQNPNGAYSEEKISEMHEDYLSRYGLRFVAYNPLECPLETTAKSPTYITQIGAYGGIIEFNCNDAQMTEAEATESGKQRRYTPFTMEQQYTLLLKFLAMWISDYEENN